MDADLSMDGKLIRVNKRRKQAIPLPTRFKDESYSCG